MLEGSLHNRSNLAKDWLKFESSFSSTWNLNHCIGALDGKHISVKAPPNSGSKHRDYKEYFSIVFLVVVDSDSCVTYFDVGCQGRISDGGVFNNCSLSKALARQSLHIPKDQPLPVRNKSVPYIIVADDAFPLTSNIMKPYPGHHEKDSKERVFNYRLSRARCTVENVFGIMNAKFRVIRKPIELDLSKAIKIVLACIILHNFIRKNKGSRNRPPGSFDFEDVESGQIIPGSWRAYDPYFTPVTSMTCRPTNQAKNIRDEFARYFSSVQGQVPWQNSVM